MGKRFKIDRRTVLRGMGGVAVGLPALELMGRPDRWGSSRARAQEGPKRFLVAYAGTSVGADAQDRDFITPNAVGRGYELREATEPLGTPGMEGVQDEISLVTGLRIPHDGSPGGRGDSTVHNRIVGCTVAGTRCIDNHVPRGPTVAEVAADRLAGNRPHRILNYVVQQGVSGAIGWEWDGSESREVDGISNPRLAYDNLFSGFTPPTVGTPAMPPQMPTGSTGAPDLALRGRRSVLDLVSASTERLMRRVGTVDRHRLELHFDQIRDLEARLAGMGGGGGSPAPTGRGCEAFDVSGASQREIGEAFGRLVVMSWACDLSSVTALSMTESKCEMDVNDISDVRGGCPRRNAFGRLQGAATDRRPSSGSWSSLRSSPSSRWKPPPPMGPRFSTTPP